MIIKTPTHYFLASGDSEGFTLLNAFDVDGLRVDWPDRWFHVRVSQTEPIVLVICKQRGDAPRPFTLLSSRR